MTETMTIEEAVALVADWIEPARQAFLAGQTVHLAFAPGDATCYQLTFVPPSAARLCSGNEYPRITIDNGLLALPDRSVPFNPNGAPYPTYVAEKIGTDNAYTVLAVGLCWFLMVNESRERAVEAYGLWLSLLRVDPLAEWDRALLTGRPLPSADL